MGVAVRRGVVAWFDVAKVMTPGRDVRCRRWSLDEVVGELDCPAVWHEDVDVDEALPARLACSQGMELDPVASYAKGLLDCGDIVGLEGGVEHAAD